MKTELTRSTRVAAGYIRHGEVVAFPTETVFGLGASVFDQAAIAKVFAAKGRPPDNPLIAHVSSVAQIADLAREITSDAQILIRAFFPGPLTLVLPKAPTVPMIATAGLETIGIRMPSHGLALEFIHECATPLVAPSANLSGRPSPTTWQAVQADLDGRISCILQGPQTKIGIESTVIDCSHGDPVVLRTGAITLEQLRNHLPGIMQATELATDTRPLSPGLRHRHYSPMATVRLIEEPGDIATPDNSAFIGLNQPASGQFALSRHCPDASAYAHDLYNFFRECDSAGIHTIFCQTVDESGIGVALMDRLRRAAQTD